MATNHPIQKCVRCGKEMYITNPCPLRQDRFVCYYCCKKCSYHIELERGAIKCSKRIIEPKVAKKKNAKKKEPPQNLDCCQLTDFMAH